MKKIPRAKHQNVKGKRLKSRRYNNKKQLNKRKVAEVLIIIIVIIMLMVKHQKHKSTIEATTNQVEQQAVANQEDSKSEEEQNQEKQPEKEITDWRLTLANYENLLPEDFTVKVEDIDKTRQFDARAINDLNNMMNAMKNDGITNIWVQSAYRSVARQKELYDASVKKYLQQGKTQEEAKEYMHTIEIMPEVGSIYDIRIKPIYQRKFEF